MLWLSFCGKYCRTKLGFWAGSPNSDVRKKLVLFQKDFQEFEFHFVEKLKGATVLYNFEKEIYRSKFCICPRGETQVGGVCLSESMAFGCVPGKNVHPRQHLEKYSVLMISWKNILI